MTGMEERHVLEMGKI